MPEVGAGGFEDADGAGVADAMAGHAREPAFLADEGAPDFGELVVALHVRGRGHRKSMIQRQPVPDVWSARGECGHAGAEPGAVARIEPAGDELAGPFRPKLLTGPGEQGDRLVRRDLLILLTEIFVILALGEELLLLVVELAE